MSALNDFVVAAGSYFGLPEGRLVEGSTVDVAGGDMELVLRIVLTTDDLVGIGQRVKAMAELEKAEATRQAAQHFGVPMPTRDDLRAQYNSMPPEQRSKFGSFAKFVQAWGQTGPYTQVHSDEHGNLTVNFQTPPTEYPDGIKVGLPAHVWVPAVELTAQQKMLAVGEDTTTGNYAMDPNDLTDEQRKAYRGNHG